MVKAKRIKNFWIAFFAVMTVLSVALCIIYSTYYQKVIRDMSSNTVDDENFYKRQLENKYQQSTYQLVDSVKNIEVNLGKAQATSDKGQQVECLLKASALAQSAVGDMSYLPIEDSQNAETIYKYLNQVSDFCAYLTKQIAQGEELTAKQRASLGQLKRISKNFYESLNKMAVGNDSMAITNSMFQNGANMLNDFVGDVKTNVFEYDKLIYDGPFSDSIKTHGYKVGTSKTDTIPQTIQELFKDYGVQSVDLARKVKGQPIVEYTVTSDKGIFDVDMLTDGRLLEISSANPDGNSNLTKEQAIDIATKFAQKANFDVEAIWVSKEQGNLYYVNMACVQDDIIIYCDMVKVSVSATDGLVVGLEAKSYHKNHQERNLSFDDFDEGKAKEAVGKNINVDSVNKAYVEKNQQYYLCYEISGTIGGDQYFIYLDKDTLKQIQVFKVIKGTEGYTVI